ncbi:MAG: Hint domain-containing protein [Archangium sp.]
MNRFILGLGAALSLASCGCVARGSKIATPRGQRRVEELAVGDEVTVVDPESGATSTSQLVAITVNPRECGSLHHARGTLCVTTDHPIYDPDARGFFPAGDWLTGKRKAVLVVTEEGPRRELLTSVEIFSRVDEVFDLTVAHEWHTFVADGVLVHNKEPICSVGVSGTSCTCANGAPGVLACTSPYGSPTCSACGFRIPDAGTDAGASDAGSDAGADDGGSDAGMDGG